MSELERVQIRIENPIMVKGINVVGSFGISTATGYQVNTCPTLMKPPKGFQSYGNIRKIVEWKSKKSLIEKKPHKDVLLDWISGYKMRGIAYEQECLRMIEVFLETKEGMRRLDRFKPTDETLSVSFIWGRTTENWFKFKKDEDYGPMRGIIQHQKGFVKLFEKEDYFFLLPPRRLCYHLKMRNSSKEDKELKRVLDKEFSFKARIKLAEKDIRMETMMDTVPVIKILYAGEYQEIQFDFERKIPDEGQVIERENIVKKDIVESFKSDLGTSGLPSDLRGKVIKYVTEEISCTMSEMIESDSWKTYLKTRHMRYKPP